MFNSSNRNTSGLSSFLVVVTKAFIAFVYFTFLVLILGAISGFIIMLCWNFLMPGIFHLPEITWVQGWVMAILCSYLFKGSTKKD